MQEDKRKEAVNEYNAAQIQILEGLEAVRRRPSMYWEYRQPRPSPFGL